MIIGPARPVPPYGEEQSNFDRFDNTCTLSFDAVFEPSEAPENIRRSLESRRFFRMDSPNGDYVEFTGVPLMVSLDDEEAMVDVVDIEILERGNRFDRQGSD